MYSLQKGFTPNAFVALAGTMLLTVYAQRVAAQQGVSTATGEGAPGLEEIVVTAQKRAENIQDVPIAVSAVKGEEMEKRGARDIQDLNGIVPNLNIATNPTGPGGANVEIRGLVQKDIEKSYDTPVGVFVDGVYLATTTGQMAHNFDFDTVQVLRGPQGSLFGRNTTGGAILIQRTVPGGDAINGTVGAGIGSFGRNDYRLVLDVPVVSDKLWIKLTGISQNGGGYMKDPINSKNDGDKDYNAGSVTLRFKASDNLEDIMTYDRIKDLSSPDPVAEFLTPTALPLPIHTPTGPIMIGPDKACVKFGTSPGFCAPSQVTTTSYANDTNVQTYVLDGLTNNLKSHIGYLDLTAITGWRKSSEESLFDYDGTPLTLYVNNRPQTYRQFTQELRAASEFSGPVNFVGGLYYFSNKYDALSDQTLSLAAVSFAPIPPSKVLHPGTEAMQSTKSYSAYTQVDYQMTTALKLSVGGNYSHDKKDFQLQPLTFTDGYFGGRVASAALLSGSASWQNFSPKVTLQYRFTPDMQAYASYSTGYNAGGFNGRATNPSNLGPYGPEKVKNYEVGLKATMFDNRLRMDAAAFHMLYKDRQQAVIGTDPVYGTSTFIQNIGGEDINGFELEATVLPIQSLRLSAALGYLDASYSSFTAALVASAGVTDNRNLEPIRSPKLTGSAQVAYTIAAPAGEVTPTVIYRFLGNYTADPLNDPRSFVPSASTLDATLAYKLETKGLVWLVSAYGRNLTDQVRKDTWTFSSGLLAYAHVTEGRNYGLDLSLKF